MSEAEELRLLRMGYDAQRRLLERCELQRGELLAALDPLRAKFRSGNSVPVERATIRAEEWAEVEAAIARAQGEAK